jgi:3-methyladenine DNA glycosylase/8-oxoguanine DNA glycosylase
MKKFVLRVKKKITFDIDDQFNFERTFYSASRFDSKLELYIKEQSVYYLTMNPGYVMLGLKYYIFNGKLCVEIFSNQKLSKDVLGKIKEELTYRLSLENNGNVFYKKYSKDKLLKTVLKRNRGKGAFKMYSLYEELIISVFLQNTTVQRTISMCQNMLSKYGTLLCFDKIELYAMWRPEDLHATDEELRRLKVGYRAKIILRITEHFINNNFSEAELRKLSTDKLEKELLKIYGVGKQTVSYIIGRAEYLKHIPLWERKILSKYIFDKELCEEKHLIAWFHEKYHQSCGLAFSLILEDIFFQHKKVPFPWLKKIMREE